MVWFSVVIKLLRRADACQAYVFCAKVSAGPTHPGCGEPGPEDGAVWQFQLWGPYVWTFKAHSYQSFCAIAGQDHGSSKPDRCGCRILRRSACDCRPGRNRGSKCDTEEMRTDIGNHPRTPPIHMPNQPQETVSFRRFYRLQPPQARLFGAALALGQEPAFEDIVRQPAAGTLATFRGRAQLRFHVFRNPDRQKIIFLGSHRTNDETSHLVTQRMECVTRCDVVNMVNNFCLR